MFDLTGKAALVTGGSRGLGRAISLAFAGQGADVAINYRGNADAAEAVAAEIAALGRRSITVQGDTSEGREACESIVKAAIDGLGTIDILVNNAGITRDNLLMRMDAEEWDAVIDTNLSGPFWMTRAVALEGVAEAGRFLADRREPRELALRQRAERVRHAGLAPAGGLGGMAVRAQLGELGLLGREGERRRRRQEERERRAQASPTYS